MPSFVSMRNLLRFFPAFLCAAAFPLASSHATTDEKQASVEVYIETSPQAGVLPDGVVWNRPLKAGDMVLPPKTTPRRASSEPSSDAPSPPVFPVGGLKAPKIAPSKNAAPPLANVGTSSTASVMLLQGLQSALQGANKKESPASTSSSSSSAPTESAKNDPTSLLDTSSKDKKTEDAQTPPSQEKPEGIAYEPGREPKTLAVMGEQDRTSIDAAAKDLDAAHSVFGAPVPEEGEAKAPSAESCVPQVTKWSRPCAQAGYPAHFDGTVVGETRVECPSGKTRDVWLENTCAPLVKQEEPIRLEPAKEGSDKTASVVVSPRDSSPLDASCGTANGLAAAAAPAANLCVKGDATTVTGSGPWLWSCLGLRGGVTVSCAAPALPSAALTESNQKKTDGSSSIQDGLCGTSNDVAAERAPKDQLCAKGTPSKVSGQGPWTWACGGIGGGKAAACTAPVKVDGMCGAASRESARTMPVQGLCDSGYASAVTGEGPWNWTCGGLHGGSATPCQAVPQVDAVCGQASMQGHANAPSDSLCSAGTPSGVEGNGPWSWSCEGSKGGATVACTAPVMINGTCGAAHGGAYIQPPEQGLCATGTPSRVTGLGPWNWTCGGLHSGTTESCTALAGTAPKAETSAAPLMQESSAPTAVTTAACGAASRIVALKAPHDKLCDSGTPSAVTGTGPWMWSCAEASGQRLACATLGRANGACGTASGVSTAQAPDWTDMCAIGAPSEATFDSKKKAWGWTCSGFMGGASAACLAPASKNAVKKMEEKESMGSCGPSSMRGTRIKPTDSLCIVGKASPVRGVGPWSWTCTGTKGSSAVCEAPLIQDGVCGAVNGSIQSSMPTASLCTAGQATEIKGDGPWLWSCIGSGGGASVSCSAVSQAQARIDGTCGAAANATMTTAPKVNLCDTGTPSAVHGEGPWTWTCSGTNGGIASTCATSKILPKAPLPPGPRVDGLCGASNGVASDVPPETGLCSAGTLSALSGDGPWNWSCLGENGGMTVSCTAPLTPPSPIVGVCGNASGIPALTMPKSALCASGISSAVSGKGPWTWSCSGTNGGGAVGCVAPLAGGSATRGMPSLVTPSTEASTPNAAPVGLVTPQLPSGQLPPLKSGDVPNLKSSKPVGKGAKSNLPAAPKEPVSSKAPDKTPSLPEDVVPMEAPKQDGAKEFLKSINKPVTDSKGQPVPGARLSLKEDISVVSFEQGSDQLDRDAVQSLEKLSDVLKANEAVRITLVAYASVDGKTEPRVARKISLNRALAIRDFLAGQGVASTRVDVKPMGANVPSGDMDRVDILVN